MGTLAALVMVVLASAAKTWALISTVLVFSQFLGSSKNVAQIAWLLSITNALSLISGN